MKIILASKSPARKKLLSQLGLKFEVVPAEIDEDKIREKSPSATVKKIAFLKANEILKKLKHDEEIIIISADTMVYRRGLYIGKPEDENEAKRILTAFSDTTHWLYSGICVLHVYPSVIASPDASGRGNLVKLRLRSLSRAQRGISPRNDNIRVFLDFDRSRVTFRKLSEEEIEEYVQENNVHLWAGAYTIEKGTAGASFIKEIEGSSSNVLGLPVKKLKKILEELI